MSDLFPEAVRDSPRLAWLKKHDLITRKDDMPHPFISDQTRPWICCNKAYTEKGFGFSKEEAILDYCELFNVKHWTVENL